MFWSFMVIFLLCNYGEQVTSEIEEIHDNLYDCDWYLFPIKEQRMMQLILVTAQQPINLQGFGNILLTRDTFKKVILRHNSHIIC